jgi:hypothetical protein
LFLLLFRGVDIVARTARTAIATEAAVTVAIATVSALAVAAEATAPVIALTVAIGLAHHRRGTFLMLFDANGEVTDHILADALLALDLGDR